MTVPWTPSATRPSAVIGVAHCHQQHHCAAEVGLLPPSLPIGEAANFLYLIDGVKPSAEKEKTLDMCYVLHADHGMNASTTTARVTIATLSDMYSAIDRHQRTLKGLLHGGANGERHQMLQRWLLAKVDAYIAECLEHMKKSWASAIALKPTLDPRAPRLRRMARSSQRQLGGQMDPR